jgi:hypothetical protein
VDVTPLARRAGAVALLAVAAACARERSPADTAMLSTAARSPIVIGVGGKPDCPGTGHWSACAVRKRLEAAGVAPQVATSLPDLPPLGATPALYRVGKSGLAIYLFADSAARARAARTLDTLRYVGAAKELTMRGETTAIQSDNLLALLFSRSEQQRERVSDALTAGPPQAEKP